MKFQDRNDLNAIGRAKSWQGLSMNRTPEEDGDELVNLLLAQRIVQNT
jgi:hypothetical protein